MIKKLLVVFAAAALISMTCFTFLHILGGFPPGWRGPPWGDGDWRGNWRGDWRGRRDLGPEVTRNLPFTGGDRLDIYYPAEITFTQGPQPRFTVTGPQGLLDQLTLGNGVLRGPDRHGFRWGGPGWDGRLRIDIVSPNTHEFHLAGAEKLSIRNYDQDSLEIHAAGAADIDGQGKAKRLDVEFAGAGHLDLSQLPVDDAKVAIAGAGDASLDPRLSADVSIAGAGHVTLKSRPPYLQTHISGFGSVDAPPAGTIPPTPPATPAPGSKT
jgi:hypothetical protein